MNELTPLRLILRAVLWLPPCFAAWYFLARPHAAIAAWLAQSGVDVAAPGIVSALEQPGVDLAFVTNLEVQAAAGRAAVLVLEVNPLLYTYGLALFAALTLAVRSPWWWLPAGAAILLPFQAWGIAFDFLSQVAVTLGPGVSNQAGFFGWRREAIALGYQAGTLLFPTLVPVVLGLALRRPDLGWRARLDGTGIS